ncbi:MAG: sulfatase-like hydrolase/transferase [Tannerellaceae bacterium]|jgi:phosphoglycerol transferase MdoB-like AlkP superfamily enzyme|nr:sulfatase-like hydrolase/transferase [Tannerellaceae bacterium]
MRQRFLFLLIVLAGWLPVLAVQKPIFMLYHYDLAEGCSLLDCLRVVWHGLKLDFTVAGYLTIVPLLCVLWSIWFPGGYLRKWLKFYFGAIALLIAMLFAADVALYTFWGFRLDATVLFYIQFPSGAATSVPASLFIRQALLVVAYALAATWMFNRAIVPLMPDSPVRRKGYASLALLIVGGLLFLPLRGYITTSKAHVGMVYFSNKQFLNHSAINPAFSLISSLYKQQDFASQFQFFPEEKREELFHSLLPVLPQDSLCSPAERVELLNTQRPDILLVLLESFSANAIEAVGGKAGVTPQLNRLSREGVLFTNIYASSFRTDRGLVAVLNGYLAQPTTSILKYPSKTQSLPSLSKSLIPQGYTAEMLYGGDINYTNMRSYLYSSGYSRITGDSDFPAASRLSQWGAHDDVAFKHLYESLLEKDSGRLFSTFLTLSSHEPFEVPYHRLKHPYLNSVAYTDSCIGDFIGKLKATPLWENLLVIFVADHGFRYPEQLKEYEPARYHIPVLWVGGAVKAPARIETIASQTDLAATLLGQLGIPHQDFLFSKDILDPRHPAYAFYTFSNGFGFVDSTGVSVYDNDSNHPILQQPAEGGESRLEKGKALLQTLYDDLGHR